MSNDRQLASCLAMIVAVAGLTGCAMLSEEAWQQPSPLSGPPPPAPEKQTRRDPQGGFTVLAGGTGQPAAERVIADIGAFAQQRGFARVATRPASTQFILGKVLLDVTFQAADSHVVATFHGPGLGRKFVDSFFRDFSRALGRQYGDENPIYENDFSSNSIL